MFKDGPSGNAHHGRRVLPAQATVVLPELHVQGAVQAVPAPRGHPPVAANQFPQFLGIRSRQTDNVVDGGRGGRGVPCASGSGCIGRAMLRDLPPTRRDRDRLGPYRCARRSRSGPPSPVCRRPAQRLRRQRTPPHAGWAGCALGLHGRLRVQPVHLPWAGVPRGGVPAQETPQMKPDLVVVREGRHRGHDVGAPPRPRAACPGAWTGRGAPCADRVAEPVRR